MAYYKYISNGKIVSVSNMQVNCDGLEEIEITEEEFNEYIENQGNLIKELASLTEWFDSYYAIHEQKYRRLDALDKLDDDGLSAKDKLQLLYQEAEIKRKRIQEIQEII